MPVQAQRVFISAATRDLQSFRHSVHIGLNKKAASIDMVVDWQEGFETGHTTISENLHQRLGRADIVIHIAGFACGDRVRVPVSGFKRPIPVLYGALPSYTQLEYLVARDLDKDVYTCIAMDPAQLDPAPPGKPSESPENIALQEAHRQHLMHGDLHQRYTFTTREELQSIIANILIRFPTATHPRCNLGTSIGTLFKGREQFLDTLRETLQAKSTDYARATVISSPRAIHGLGGVGKTRSAIEYGLQHREEYTALLIVRADSPETLRSNIAELAGFNVFNLPEQKAPDFESRLHSVYTWLEEHPRWFLIIDNVDTDEAAREVKKLLAMEQLRRGDIIITTRLRNWSNQVVTLNLDVLDEKSAVEFLKESTGQRPQTTTDEEQVALLAKALDGLALALEQAGAYIKERNVSFAVYLRFLQTAPKEVLDWADEQIMEYPYSVAKTLQLSIAKLGSSARALLGLLANLAPAPIPRGLLETGEAYSILGKLLQTGGSAASVPPATAPVSEMTMRTAEGELTKYSLARNLVEPAECLSIHRLVQEIVVRFTVTDAEERIRWELTIQLVNEFAPPSLEDASSWPVWTLLAPHAEALIARAEVYGVPPCLQKLMDSYALFLQYGNTNYHAAEALFRRVMDVREATLKTDALETLESVSNLGFLLYRKGDIAAAEKLLARVMHAREAVLGSEDPNTLVSANKLGRLYLNQNRFDKAEVLFTRVLEARRRILGEREIDTIISMNNLGQLMSAMGNYDAAGKLYREALGICETDKRSLRITFLMLNNLAFFLWRSGNPVEAEPLARRALVGREELFGENHQTTLFSVNHLGLVLTALGQMDAAEVLFRRALNGRKQLLGEEHHYTLLSLHDLAVLIGKRGDFADAEELLRKCLDSLTKKCGPDDPDTLACACNLAELLHAEGNLTAAEPFYQRAQKGYEQVLGKQHPVSIAAQRKWDAFVAAREARPH